jgi:hypothetical protein
MTLDQEEWARMADCLARYESHVHVPERIGPALPGGEWMSVLRSMSGAARRYVEAPVTTWAQELEVRGYVFQKPAALKGRRIGAMLHRLLDGLASMRVFVMNTDHLSDRSLYQRLWSRHLREPVLLLEDADCICHYQIDVVGFEMQDDPRSWLAYYATSRERVEWALQNPGCPLPPSMPFPYHRDQGLPSPQGRWLS